MEQDSEWQPAVRPKRRVRPPQRFDDYEVGYPQRHQPEWNLPRPAADFPLLSPQHTPVLRTSLQTSRTFPGEGSHGGAAHQETPQLAPSYLQRSNWEINTFPEAASAYQQSPFPDHRSFTELRAMQEENSRFLHESIRELNAARCEMKALIEAAHSLRADMKQFPPTECRSEPPPPPSLTNLAPNLALSVPEEDDEWPDPPPWPEPYEELHSGLKNLKVEEQQPEGNRFQSSFTPLCPQHTQLPPPAASTKKPPVMQLSHHAVMPPAAELVYRGPKPSVPKLINPDPSEFARLRIALENLLPPDSTELFKYQILTDHLKLDEAKLIADAYLNSPRPYSDTMSALHEKFGQPHQLAIRRIAHVLEGPEIRRGDAAAFQKFSLQIQSLVGLLQTLGAEGQVELNCGSHVARLLSKLPAEQRADFRRHHFKEPGYTFTLCDLSDWLRYESWCQAFDSQITSKGPKDRPTMRTDGRHTKQSVTVLHGVKVASDTHSSQSSERKRYQNNVYCAYCESKEHYFSQCGDVASLSKDQLKEWIQANKRCWRCARAHQAAQCTLRKPCRLCQGKHLLALHDINTRTARSNASEAVKEESCLTSSVSETFFLDRPCDGSRVLLKVVPVALHYGGHTLETFAILDDGSERTMLLQAAAKFLGMRGTPENLPLRTVRQDVQVLHGHTISFSVSSVSNPQLQYNIRGAFTARRLDLAHHTYPINQLQRKFKHLRGLPIPALKDVKPLLLIGSDQPHLITPTEPVRLGPPGSPAAISTRLGWTLQGPSQFMGRPASASLCMFTSAPTQTDDLYKHVERLWRVDVLPHRSEKEVTRSKQDQQAIALLETRTVRTMVDGVLRYATPLLRRENMPPLNAPKDSVMPLLRSTERRLMKDPSQAEAYRTEMQKMIEAGVVHEIAEDTSSAESWYIPHHLVSHNGKNRIVFNCSHKYLGQSLNQFLLPGPTLGASLLGVLIRFREHPVAVSGDIRGMFHQVRLLPEDRPLLRFLWRDLKVHEPPKIFEWQVLPFGTTSSPCCATYALQRHVTDHSQPDDVLRASVENCFYVDNCLQSVESSEEAKTLVDHLRDVLASAGFELRQWACNDPNVLSHLPPEARSKSLELWLAEDKSNPQETTLGLVWDWRTDHLGYKHRPVIYETPTLRNIYRVLASQYDPLGFLLPYTTRAKLILRQLWDKPHDWDETNLPSQLLQAWAKWEAELEFLVHITFPRPYAPPDSSSNGATREVHVFSDASERAYGAVAYMRTETLEGKVTLSFILARSRVAPKRPLSIPRLELCAALVAAQLANLLKRELTVPVGRFVLWSDSTTVLTWLGSQSCRFKVFVGARVAEIQELTEHGAWKYVGSRDNPADDLTRGKALNELTVPNRWSQGPPFLVQSPNTWPEEPNFEPSDDKSELRTTMFCGVTSVPVGKGIQEYRSWQELLDARAQELNDQAPSTSPLSADDYRQAEIVVLRQAQQQSFPGDYKLLAAGKPVSVRSRLLTLAPELDKSTQLIRVGGRLRRLGSLDGPPLHPIVLDAAHPTTRLLIQKCDSDLQHPGSERVFAELRRSYWILRGREAIRKHQRMCPDCQRWRAKPAVPRMADLPAARLRLFKPPFYSTGMDCFGPLYVKVGRRHEKRWGIIFKCLTTRAVHLDLLSNMETDAFLMALRRFIARRGTPAELWSDQVTNFKGGERELKEAFDSMTAPLQDLLARQKIQFRFNPPAAPHFGGVWEREIRSVKTALRNCVGAQPVPEDVLLTVLLEVEAILNSKPLGYVSTDVADVDPITPNTLLMGRPNGSLPQVVYPETELLSRRRWRHSQVLADHFWSRFIREYLPNLQVRQKWHSVPPDILEKAVVMVVDPQLPRSLWPIGQVTKINRSDDGCIRSADVAIKGHVYTRPVARLVILPALPAAEDHTLQHA